MPELPEVETVRRGLERAIVGKTVATVDIRVSKIFSAERSLIDRAMIGATVTQVDRRAKLLLISLSSGFTLAIHLKMTGQIIVVSREKINARETGHQSSHLSPLTTHLTGFVGGHPERAYEQPLPHRHTHVTVTFIDGTVLYFNDLRKFGWLRLFGQRTIQNGERQAQPKVQSQPTIEDFLEKLNYGPEPLEAALTLGYFRQGIKARTIVVKALLLDQSFIAGIGNIYADEALFAALIKPTRRANTLSKAEGERLFAAMRQVLELGIKQGGTSFNSYRTVEGTPGNMREHLKVYGREGHPCVRCGEPIVRKKLGQRSAHFCSSCQR